MGGRLEFHVIYHIVYLNRSWHIAKTFKFPLGIGVAMLGVFATHLDRSVSVCLADGLVICLYRVLVRGKFRVCF